MTADIHLSVAPSTEMNDDVVNQNCLIQMTTIMTNIEAVSKVVSQKNCYHREKFI